MLSDFFVGANIVRLLFQNLVIHKNLIGVPGKRELFGEEEKGTECLL